MKTKYESRETVPFSCDSSPGAAESTAVLLVTFAPDERGGPRGASITFGGLAARVRAVTKSVRFVAAQMVFSSHSEETPPALSGSVSVSWRMIREFHCKVFAVFPILLNRCSEAESAQVGNVWPSCARIYRPSFRENMPKTLVFNHWTWIFYFQWQNCDILTKIILAY